MAKAVLDASAVLALLVGEKGSEQVKPLLGSVLVSAVNLAEVLAKLADRGVSPEEQRQIREGLDVEVREFDERSARTSAGLRSATRTHGLSIGDRACLALALQESLPVLTTDRTWSKLALGIEVRVLR
jgi:PIN domain nuclease of toxin-antitoxin system